MSDFCRQHAFYDCPICRGEEVTWVIPVVDGRDMHDQRVIGVIEIPEDMGDDLPSWDIEVPYEGPGIELPPLPIPAHAADALEAVREMFDWRNTPEMKAAAEKGRRVHEDALTLIEEDPTISYQEAIEEILQGRGDD